MANYNRKQILILVVFAFADFCSALCVSLQAPFYPAEAERKGATPTEYGLVFGIFELTVFFISPIYGKFMSTIGPSFLFSTGIFTTGTTCILFGFLDKIHKTSAFVGFSFAVRIVEALGNAAFLTASFSLIAEEFPNAVGGTFACLETCYGMGLIFGPTIGGALYELGGYTLPFLCLGITLVFVAIVIKFILPSDNVETSINHHETSNLWPVLRIPIVAILVYVNIVTALSIGFLQATLEPYLRPLGLSPFQTGLMFILNGGAYAITAPIWGVLCDKFVLSQYIVGLGSILTSIAFLLVGPAFFIPLDSTLPLCIGALILHGIGLGAEVVGTFSGTQKEAIKRGFPDNLDTYGLVSGIWTSSFAFGAFVGPTIAGYLYDLIGFRCSTVVIVALHLLAFLVLALYQCTQYQCTENTDYLQYDEEAKTLLGVDSAKFYGASDDSCYNSSLNSSNDSRISSSNLVL